MHIDLIVSRHPAGIEFIRRETGTDAPMMGAALPEEVAGKIVAGNLPLRLAALAAEVVALEFRVPPRGAEFTLGDMYAAGARLERYVVRRPGSPGLTDEIRQLAEQFGAVRAVTHYRELTGASLTAARDAVNGILGREQPNAAETGWIATAERLPAVGEDVLAWGPGFRAPRTGRLYRFHWPAENPPLKWDFESRYGMDALDEVTHWRPLPALGEDMRPAG